jgi:hypothetical protein
MQRVNQWQKPYTVSARAMLWGSAALFSLFVCAIFYYWFAVADRYAIFLYNHLLATPFDARTSSRYWMAGLVAAGMVTIIYAVVSWYAGRLAALRYRRYQPPPWWQLWVLLALPLSISIPAIVMRVNQPTLPFSLALAALATTLIGLAIGLPLASLAAQKMERLLWLLVIGMGLVPSLLLLRVLELPAQGLVDPRQAVIVAVGSTVAGFFWLILLSWYFKRRQYQAFSAFELFLAGLCISYLLLPLAHYLLLTPPSYRYITVADNFFSRDPLVQLACLATAFLLAVVTVRVGRRMKNEE